MRSETKQRSLNACLIAGIAHLCFVIVLTLFHYAKISNDFEDVVEVEFVDMEETEKQRRRPKQLPKKLFNPKQAKSLTSSRPRHVALKASSNLIDETVRPSEKILMQSATKSVSKTETELPEVTTQAERLNNRTAAIPKTVASPFEITAGSGVKSLRQRAKGEGKSGFHRLESTGTAEVGTIGDGIGEGGGGGDGPGESGPSPFGEALEEIAEHIIAIRTLDKVNVVFVLDTSASMRDNIQQVAENLYSMTDAFDVANLEYHLGMAEFSVRQKGQELKTRALLPDVGVLRRRMHETQLSGDENALDALLDTLNFMNFHTDAEKHLILVTDEPATTRLRDDPSTIRLVEEKVIEKMRKKVIDQSQFEEIHVNVLGFPEPFQQTLAETTGGIWQQIPGRIHNATALPSNRVGNRKLLKIFQEIAADMQQSSRKFLFSLELQFQVPIETGEEPLKKMQQGLNDNGIVLKADTYDSKNATILIQHNGDLWIITDHTNKQIYAIHRIKDKLNVFAGTYIKSWNLDENMVARPQARDIRWTFTDHVNNQIYTFRRHENLLNAYIGGQPGAGTTVKKSAEPIIDVMVMLDYSRSMGGKSQAIMLGLSTLIGRLSILPIKYRIGLIRFAEAKDAIKVVNGAVVSQMPLNEVLIERFLQDPFGGDEHLIDAIVEGVPKVKFSPYARRFLLILTDEPTTGKYPAEQALQLCESLNITAYVIGHPDPTDFQTMLATQTKGFFFPMPNHLEKGYPNQ